MYVELERIGAISSPRTGGDSVDANAVLAAQLPGENARVALERRLCGAHAAPVAGHHALRRDVRERHARAFTHEES